MEKSLDKCIAITLYRRPDQTARLLANLDQCYGIEDYTIFIHQDWSVAHEAACVESTGVAGRWSRMRPDRYVFAAGINRGVDLAKLRILEQAYRAANYVIFLEDDTQLSKDALRWFEWAAPHYSGNPNVVSISGYNRTTGMTSQAASVMLDWFTTSPGFKPWGWAMTRDNYDALYGRDGSKYLAIAGDEANGRFDWFMSEKGLLYAHPIVPRTNHATWENAEHTPSREWWAENECAWIGAWDMDVAYKSTTWGNTL